MRQRVEFFLGKFPKVALLTSWLEEHGAAYGSASGPPPPPAAATAKFDL
jgi:hypothetical protein